LGIAVGWGIAAVDGKLKREGRLGFIDSSNFFGVLGPRFMGVEAQTGWMVRLGGLTLLRAKVKWWRHFVHIHVMSGLVVVSIRDDGCYEMLLRFSMVGVA
jgi:hypothetical protein